jgi:hypothetical protein
LLSGGCDHLFGEIEAINSGRISRDQLAAHQAFTAAQIPEMQTTDVTQDLNDTGSGGEVAEYNWLLATPGCYGGVVKLAVV